MVMGNIPKVCYSKGSIYSKNLHYKRLITIIAVGLPETFKKMTSHQCSYTRHPPIHGTVDEVSGQSASTWSDGNFLLVVGIQTCSQNVSHVSQV